MIAARLPHPQLLKRGILHVRRVHQAQSLAHSKPPVLLEHTSHVRAFANLVADLVLDATYLFSLFEAPPRPARRR
jgi:hypothetical protein